MRILLVYGANPKSKSRKINLDFIKKIGNLCTNFNILFAKDLMNQKKNMIDYYYDLKPDVMICYAKTKKYNRLPSNIFRDLPCLKVMIEVDYKKGMIPWYRKNKFNFIFKRGSYARRSNTGIPTTWLPFSADASLFKHSFDIEKRIKKVGFSATLNKAYTQRKKVVQKLEEYKLVTIKKIYDPKEYANFLGSFLIGLDTPERRMTPHGKTFETIASGAVLLTGPFYGHNTLFDPSKKSFIQFGSKLEGLVKEVHKVINDIDLAKEIVKNSKQTFLERHTDEIRIKELYDHLQNLLKGKSIERKWGY